MFNNGTAWPPALPGGPRAAGLANGIKFQLCYCNAVQQVFRQQELVEPQHVPWPSCHLGILAPTLQTFSRTPAENWSPRTMRSLRSGTENRTSIGRSSPWAHVVTSCHVMSCHVTSCMLTFGRPVASAHWSGPGSAPTNRGPQALSVLA